MGNSSAIGSTTGSGSAAKRPAAKVSSGSKVRSSAPLRSTARGKSPVKPAAKNPSEVASISKDAAKPDKPNAMAEGIKKNWTEKGLETSDGNKLGQYKKTGEGTIEKELLKKGFTMKEIYTKDKQGRTLADQVAQTNGIKDQKKIADGKELTLPQLKGAQGQSSADLKPGQEQAIQASNSNGDTTGKITQKKDSQDVTRTNLEMASQGNRANIPQQTDGNATISIAPVGNGLREVSTQHSPNNEAIDTTVVQGENGRIGFDYKDIDGKRNTEATSGPGGVTLTNPDGQGRGNQTTIPLGPQSGFQRIAQKGDELGGSLLPSFFRPQQVTGLDAPVGQIGSVDGAQQRDGSARYNIRQADGNVQQVGQTASGRLLGAAQSIEDTAFKAWNSVKNFFTGS